MKPCLVSALLLLLSGPAQALGESHSERVAAVLQRRTPETRTAAQLAQELAGLGPELIPLWRGWLVGEGVEAVFLAQGVHHPEAWVVAPEAACDLALATLAVLPAQHVLADLERGILRDGPHASEYLAAFRVLTALGSARGLALYWRIAEELGSDVVELPRLRAAAEGALVAMMERDRDVWGQLPERLAKPEAFEAELFLGAACAAGRAEAHELVLELLDGGLDTTLRLDALRTLARLEREHPWRFEPELVERVEAEWPRLALEQRLAAIRLLGASEDPQALAPLGRLLADTDPLLARNASSALAELARIDFGQDEQAWERWEERELAWWSAEFEPTLAALAGPATAAATFAELAAHPLFRRDIARAVGTRLCALDPKVQALGASFLCALGTRAGLPGLAGLAQHCPDPELRIRLQTALTTLGGSAVLARLDEVGG